MLTVCCNGTDRIGRMDCAWIHAHSSGHGSCMEDRQASTVPSRGKGPLMDYYTIAGLATMALVASIVGLRVAKDEMLLRRKRELMD